jgi:DNA mismatch endonuclease, patch repair protein
MTETSAARRRIMQAVRSKDTTPELLVRRLVTALGYRYRLHRRDLPGKPDLAFIGRRKVVFVHGCFWHGHNCARGAREPRSNRAYWLRKIDGNRLRDRAHLDALARTGWRALVVWECELKESAKVTRQLSRFLKERHGKHQSYSERSPRR